MTNEERKDKYMNRNIKILPTYYALTWDILFVFTISTLFFTQQKGLNYSQVLILDSVLTFSACLMCLPISKIFAKLTPLQSSQISNFGYLFYLLFCIFGTNFFMFVLAQICLAFAYSIKSVKDNLILLESLQLVKRDKDYQRVYGSGISIYYIIEAIGAIGITYVYTFNPYLAYYIPLVIVVLSMIYSLFIKDPKKFMPSNISIEAKVNELTIEKTEAKENNNNKTLKKKVKNPNTPDSYFKILSSSFFITMIVYLFFFRGVVAVDTSIFKIYLQMLTDSNVIPVWAFGVIFAGVRLSTGISTKYQFKYNLKFGVKSLIIFNVLLIATFVINGLVYMFSPYSVVSIVIITISSYIQCSLRVPNSIFCDSYMQVCMPKKNLERAYGIRKTIEYLGYAMMSFLFSQILAWNGDNYGKANLIYISIFIIPLLASLIFFLNRLIRKYTKKYTIIKQEYVED